MIETRKTELRCKTSEPKKMLNKWIASRVLKTWIEDFVDEGKGEVVSIERNEVLFDRGTLIDQDTLAQIRFFIEAGDISQVDVSNQKRLAFVVENTTMHPFIAQVRIFDKNYKFLFYSTSVENSIELLKDYVELNYSGGFHIVMIKEFDSCIILTDKFKEARVDALEGEEMQEEKAPESDNDNKKKFYQIEVTVTYGEEGEDPDQTLKTFVVNTYNVDRAMMVINNYLNREQSRREQNAIAKGNEYKKLEITTSIESAKPLPVGCFIPKEFSEAYL